MNKLNSTTTTQRIFRPRVPNATALTSSQKLDAALKQLREQFSQIVEIGKFKPIKADIQDPVKDSVIKKASIVIEPLADKKDFRTRTISFVAYSPFEEGKIHDITIANGNTLNHCVLPMPHLYLSIIKPIHPAVAAYNFA